MPELGPGRGENLRGAAFMSASMAGFCLNDTLVKSLSDELPLLQTVFLRGLFATAFVGLIAWRAGALRARPGARDARLMGLRLVGEVGANLAFLTALFHMPLAEATAVMQAIPIAVLLAAAILLGEFIGRGQALAVAAGFLGVLVIIRPGAAGFNAYSLLALAAVGFVVLRELSTRRLSPDASSAFVVLVTSAGLTLVTGLGALAIDWAPVGPSQVLRLAAAAVALLLGYLCGVRSMRMGAIGFTQPFRYSLILWAILLGFLVFGETPDLATLAGAAILVATGLVTLRGETRARETGAPPLSPRAAEP